MILTDSQLGLLLVSRGYDGAAGLALGGGDRTPVGMLSAVNGLASLGLVRQEGERFVCTQRATQIADRIGAAQRYIAVHTARQGLPDLCCFGTETLLVCAPQLTAGDKKSVRQTSVGELIALLRDDGYFPQETERFEPEEEALKRFEKERFSALDPNSPVDRESDILFSAECMDKNGCLHACVRVMEYYFYRYLYCLSAGETQRKHYSPQALADCLKGLMKQND